MGEKALIVASGLSSALGRAVLERLSPGQRVLALGRTPIEGPNVTWIPTDFRKPFSTWGPEVRAALNGQAVRGFLHAAGTVYADRVEYTTEDEWNATWQVNVGTAFYLSQILSEHFKPGASVVMVTSVDAWHQSALGPAAAYGVSKAALMGLVRHLAAEWGSRGIRVNALAPGALSTGSGPTSQTNGQAIARHIALGRLGRADEVAQVICFLLSPQASYVTGAWIPVDGGLNIRY